MPFRSDIEQVYALDGEGPVGASVPALGLSNKVGHRFNRTPLTTPSSSISCWDKLIMNHDIKCEPPPPHTHNTHTHTTHILLTAPPPSSPPHAQAVFADEVGALADATVSEDKGYHADGVVLPFVPSNFTGASCQSAQSQHAVTRHTSPSAHTHQRNPRAFRAQ